MWTKIKKQQQPGEDGDNYDDNDDVMVMRKRSGLRVFFENVELNNTTKLNIFIF